ncbi:MAG: hypothetical protein HY913_04460 [Desulfomonile tiedjei]|nr:hypothetical protein [Desulfomonile tiedjei]
MSITASYVSLNQFTVAENRTENLPPGLRLKLFMGTDGIEEVTVDSSSYNSGTGLTACTIKESVITPNLATIKPADNYTSNVGVHAHTDDASGGEIPAAHLSEAEVENIHNTPIPQTGDGKRFVRIADTPSEGYALFDLIGAANQLVGANAAGDEIQFKTLTGATDEISVEDVDGTISIGLVQDYYTSTEINTALGIRDSAIAAAQSDIDTHEVAAAPHSGHAPSSHTHAAGDVSSGTLDGDRLPTISGTKRGGVPNTSGTPGSKVLYDDDTWKEPPGAVGGEANTTSNEGGGVGLAKSKDGINLPFKTFDSAQFSAPSDVVSVLDWASFLQDFIKKQNDGRMGRVSDTSLTWTGYQIGLWDSTANAWKLVKPSSAPSITNAGLDVDNNALTYDFNYDVFLVRVSDTEAAFAFKKWTDDTTRAVVPALWQGIYCYDNLTDIGKSRLYIGMIRLRNDGGVAKFTDSATKRFVANAYNQAHRQLKAALAGSQYTYNSSTWRKGNNDDSTKVEWLSALDSQYIEFQARHHQTATTGYNTNACTGVSVDSTSSHADCLPSKSGWNSPQWLTPWVPLKTTVNAGYHYAYLVESSDQNLQATFYANSVGAISGRVSV